MQTAATYGQTADNLPYNGSWSYTYTHADYDELLKGGVYGFCLSRVLSPCSLLMPHDRGDVTIFFRGSSREGSSTLEMCMPSETRADLEKIKSSHRRTFPWPRRTLIQRNMLEQKKSCDDFGPVVQESARSNNATSIIARVSVRSMGLPRVFYAIQSSRIRHPGSVRAIMLRYYPS